MIPCPRWEDVTEYSAENESDTHAAADDLPWDEDDLPWDENDGDEGNTAAALSHFPTDNRVTDLPEADGAGESLSPDGDVRDPRLLAADEESARLLEEETAPSPEPAVAAIPAGERSPKEREGSAAKAGADKPTKASKPADLPPTDPLQLGLDDVYPRVETLAPQKSTAKAPQVPTSAYAARMTRDAREEAVRDTEMFLRLGYEKQMLRSEQQEAVEEARRRADERARQTAGNESSAVRVTHEYTDKKQTPSIERAYIRARRLCVTRLCVAAVGALFGILHDYLGEFFTSFNSLTYADTVLYPVVGLLWTVLICLPFLPRLGKGLKSLFDFEPTRYAVSALGLLVAVAHGALAIFVHRPYLYGGVALLMLTVAAASEYMTTVAEHRAFSVVSSGKTAFILTDEVTPASAARVEPDPVERSLTASRAGRISDYFARTGRYNPYMGRLNYLLPVALLASIGCAGMAILRGGELLYDGIPVFTATYLSCLPAAYLLSMSLPLLRSNGLLRSKGAAVIGTAAAVDYTKKGSARILIRDGDALGGLFRKEITLRNDPHPEIWRSRASKLFSLLECPLRTESLPGGDRTDGLCVEVAETEEGFVRLYLIDLVNDETTEVMMGSHDALARRAIRLPKPSMERVFKKTEDSQVIYLAFDRVFRIAYSVEYRVGATFARVVEKLASMGDKAALVTYDPLVKAELVSSDRFRSLPSVELVRPAYAESVRESLSGGVVATGRSTDLLYTYAACRRMRKAYRLSHVFTWCAILGALILSLLTVFTGSSTVLTPAVVTVWQILLTALSVAVSLTNVNRKSLFLSADGKKPDQEKSSAPIQHTTTKTDKDTSTT